MRNTLHVGNLSRSFDDLDLERLFAAYGTVKLAEVRVDPLTGLGTGDALVEMGSDREADAAAAALHGVECCDHVLSVTRSTAAEETSAGRPRMFTPMDTPGEA